MKRTARSLDGLSEDEQEESTYRFQGKATEKEWSDRRVFARNLDTLIQMKEFTLKGLAEKIGANYQWMRRIVTRGIVRITEENQPCLKKMANLFGISRIEDLWMPDLIVFKVKGQVAALTDEWLRNAEFVSYAKKLILLLDSGQHDYLKSLIDNLHELLSNDSPKSGK